MQQVSVMVVRAAGSSYSPFPPWEKVAQSEPLLVLSYARLRDGMTQAKYFLCLYMRVSWVSVLHSVSATLPLYSRVLLEIFPLACSCLFIVLVVFWG